MKKKILTGLAAFSLCLMTAIPALADTVYYNGDAVNWDYGTHWAVYSYSDVQTGKYTHSSTANSTFSGWQKPGTLAHAEQFIGLDTATAYWDCE